ncbi:hypothetical protein BKA93DRAFT_792294 [Sparassis latifolia]
MHINKHSSPSPFCTLGDFGVGRVHSCPPIERISHPNGEEGMIMLTFLVSTPSNGTRGTACL